MRRISPAQRQLIFTFIERHRVLSLSRFFLFNDDFKRLVQLGDIALLFDRAGRLQRDQLAHFHRFPILLFVKRPAVRHSQRHDDVFQLAILRRGDQRFPGLVGETGLAAGTEFKIAQQLVGIFPA